MGLQKLSKWSISMGIRWFTQVKGDERQI